MNRKLLNFVKYILLIGIVLAISRFILFRDKVKAVPVRKATIEQRVVEKTISASGEVKARKSANLTFETSSGQITKIYIAEGDEVKRGQLLASLDTAIANQTLQTYRDARDVAIKDRDIYVQTYHNHTSLVGGKSEYELNVKRLEELISKAEASYKAQQHVFQNSFIYAPYEGTILAILKKEGDSASALEPIIKIADLTDLYFEVTLDQEDFGLVKLGQKVTLDLDAFSSSEFSGEVAKLPQFANGGASPSFTVEIAVAGGQKNILLGMTGDARIVAQTTTEPVGSLLYDELSFDSEDNPFVWVLRGKTLSKKPIEIGLEGDIYTQIKTEIAEDIYIGIGDVTIEEGFNALVQP